MHNMKIYQYNTYKGKHTIERTFDSIVELLLYINERNFSFEEDNITVTYPANNINNNNGKCPAHMNYGYVIEFENDEDEKLADKQIIFTFGDLIDLPDNNIVYDNILEIPEFDSYIIPGATYSIREIVNALNGPLNTEINYVPTKTKVKTINNYNNIYIIIKNS